MKLRDPLVKAQLLFLESLEMVFNGFLTLFQKEEPLVHILYDQLSELVHTLLWHFLKADAVGEERGHKLLLVDVSRTENQLTDQVMVVGESTQAAMKKMKLDQ